MDNEKNDFVRKKDWSRVKDNEHTISMWCTSCKGTGRQRLRSGGVIPRVRIIQCKKCKGRFRVWYRPDSEELKEALKLTHGLWKWDGKHKEHAGISRR